MDLAEQICDLNGEKNCGQLFFIRILKIEIIFHYVFISFLGASTKTLINIGLGMFLSLLVAVSILGNILVCAAIWTDKNLRKVKDLFSLANFSVL